MAGAAGCQEVPGIKRFYLEAVPDKDTTPMAGPLHPFLTPGHPVHSWWSDCTHFCHSWSCTLVPKHQAHPPTLGLYPPHRESWG